MPFKPERFAPGVDIDDVYSGDICIESMGVYDEPELSTQQGHASVVAVGGNMDSRHVTTVHSPQPLIGWDFVERSCPQ